MRLDLPQQPAQLLQLAALLAVVVLAHVAPRSARRRRSCRPFCHRYLWLRDLCYLLLGARGCGRCGAGPLQRGENDFILGRRVELADGSDEAMPLHQGRQLRGAHPALGAAQSPHLCCKAVQRRADSLVEVEDFLQGGPVRVRCVGLYLYLYAINQSFHGCKKADPALHAAPSSLTRRGGLVLGRHPASSKS